MQEDIHVFQGMKRDSHPIKQERQFLWDALNIRLTTRDGDSMLSLTNEKSTREIMRFSETNETYIGHCVLGKYLIVFTKSDSGDTIYRIELDKNIKTILYRGELGFDTEYPIQALGDYESELVQKVYWVDGKNSPKTINITKPELLEVSNSDNYSNIYKEEPFGFVQTLELNESVTVNRLPNGSGVFPAGVIQYAFTYYYKYGQESNIFYVTEPLYISYNDRGGRPDDSVSTAFSIEIKNPQSKFQYLRIYSIIRTSIDATPSVKRVTDISIEDINTRATRAITYVDNGTTGDVVDPTMLLYVGGKDIIAGCISAKDNTLFLGDISYNRKEAANITGLKGTLVASDISSNKRTVNLNTDTDSSSDSNSFLYRYKNQLLENTSTFKVGETYRLGYQLQYKNGEWSEPIFICDKELSGVKPSISGATLSIPIFECSINKLVQSSSFNLINEGYLKVRPLVVLPSTKDKTILAQGILCPTVFNANARNDNTPFAQSSWLLRPFISSSAFTSNNGNPQVGAIAEFRHYNPLFTGFDRGSEIQNMFLDSDAGSDTTDNFDPSLKNTKEALTGKDLDSSYGSLYYVDQSVLTFHSPDIEFDDSTMSAVSGNGLVVKLVGAVPFTSNCGDIDIQVSSVVADPDASGFIHRTLINPIDGGKSLISGLFYEDAWVDEGKGANEYYKDGNIRPWLTYLWHRSGSLNNDCIRPEGRGSRTSVLKKKVISNMKFSKDNLWLNSVRDLDTSDLQVFNSNEVSLLKIEDSKNKRGDITYYGNVDSMNPSYSRFRLVVGEVASYELVSGNIVLSFNITVGNDTGVVNRFVSVTVDPQTGNASTGSMRGIVVSNTTVTIPTTREVEVEDGEGNITIETITENQEILLRDAIIDIIIEGGGGYREFSGAIQIKEGDSYTTTFSISGNTNYEIKYVKKARAQIAFNFSASLASVDPSNGYVGDYQESLKLPKDAVRIKYKSTPHVLFANRYNGGSRKPLPIISGTKTYDSGKGVSPNDVYWLNEVPTSINQETIPYSQLGATSCPSAYLWLAEIHQTNIQNRFGGTTLEALQNNLWIPAGPAVRLDTEGAKLRWMWGDTWYQRYDCLKTYPFTQEDENQVVEIGSFMCETRVNIDGRYDRNRGALSNLNMSPINFNLINPVYTQKNTFFNYRILDEDYYKVTAYPSQLMWTGVKTPSAFQDAWTNLHTASSIDLDGSSGRLVAVQPFNELLIGFQEKGVQQILFNSRVQIQPTDGLPIEIASSQKVEGSRAYSNTIGCQDKFSLVNTPMGIYFVDNNSNSIYLFNGQLNNIGLQLGSLYWPRENHSDMTWKFSTKVAGRNGVRLFYDSKYQDVYLTPGTDSTGVTREALCYSEQLGQFTSLMSYGGSVMFPFNSKFYSIANSPSGVLTLWENFPSDLNSYNEIFGATRPFSFSFISNANPTVNKIFDTVEMRADCYNYSELLGDKLTHVVQDGKPFNYIRVDNEYQDTDKVYLNDSLFRKKFRVWRALVPRNKGTRERVRNLWAKVTLGSDDPSTKFSILHDIAVKYTI